MKTIKTNDATRIVALALLFLSFIVSTAVQAQVSGAVFTTDSSCSGTDLNIYGSKSDVYVDGGPAGKSGSGLPPGSYCVQVTAPDGTVLGVSAPGAVTVNSSGSFVQCYQLSAILNTASSGFTAAGYDDTNNPGGEYKVWVSTDCTFNPSSSKTDNFKVKSGGGGPGSTATICVTKFYDANANGVQDPGEPNIVGWEYCIVGVSGFTDKRFTFNPPQCLVVDPDTYSVTEGTPVETSWVHTTATEVDFTLAAGGSQNVSFGNVCLGPGGGLTLGFWSNKNGQAMITKAELCFLDSLCLTATGSHFAPVAGCPTPSSAQFSAGKTALRNWLLNATAVNMAYMLSAQLATMELNVLSGSVSGSALVYEPCLITYGFSTTGFISINDLMTDANNALCASGGGYTPSGSPNRAAEECLKNALDHANNNLNFVQGAPCPFSFSTTDTCPFTNP
jgi:hypothetical protein